MNFFGHALVATRHGQDPSFVLGAMLPDLVAMLGRPLGLITDPRLKAGVDMHHATDRVFHAAPEFVQLCAKAVARLSHEGLSRGSARAVGHVGVELLLDGWLSDEQDVMAPYRHALNHGGSREAMAGWRWRDGGTAGHFPNMLQRLHDSPLPQAYREPDVVADRLDRILARRPRLALGPDDGPAVQRWARDTQPALQAVAAQLMERVHGGLSANPGRED